MVFFLQQLVQGLAIGSIYGLIAIGYVLIYNTWGVLNFAQGDMVMVGAFTVLVTHSMMGLPMFLAIPLAILMCVVIGFIIELTAFRPLLNAENQRRLIATIGVGIFLAFTAYDTQKIRAYYQAYQGDQAMLERASIFSALQLYLDFVNLFLYLLRLLGKSRK